MRGEAPERTGDDRQTGIARQAAVVVSGCLVLVFTAWFLAPGLFSPLQSFLDRTGETTAKTIPPTAEESGIPDRTAAGPDQARPGADSESATAANDPNSPDSNGVSDDDEILRPLNRAAGDDQGESPERLAISGSVIDDRGHPLEGIRIAAVPEAAGRPRSAGASDQAGAVSAVSDPLGLFALEPLADGEYLLDVEGDETVHGKQVRARAGIDALEIRLQRARELRVHGQVTDSNGAPLAAVRVRVLGQRAASRTSEEGHYEIQTGLLSAGDPPVVDFQHPEFRGARVRASEALAADSDSVQVDVQMEAAGDLAEIHGHVIGPRGEPVQGARIIAATGQPGGDRQARSGELGQYSVSGIDSGIPLVLRVSADGDYLRYQSEPISPDPGGTHYLVRLEAAEEAALSGRLINPEGRPLPGFSVWLHSPGQPGHPPRSIRTDAQGWFEIERLPAGRIRLETRSLPRLRATGIELTAGEQNHVEAPMDWGESWLFGQVVDEAGEPVTGARVTLQWSEQFYGIQSASHRQGATDLGGYFTFSNLGGFSYHLTVEAPGFRTLRRTLSPGPEERRLALQSAAAGGTGGGR